MDGRLRAWAVPRRAGGGAGAMHPQLFYCREPDLGAGFGQSLVQRFRRGLGRNRVQPPRVPDADAQPVMANFIPADQETGPFGPAQSGPRNESRKVI